MRILSITIIFFASFSLISAQSFEPIYNSSLHRDTLLTKIDTSYYEPYGSCKSVNPINDNVKLLLIDYFRKTRENQELHLISYKHITDEHLAIIVLKNGKYSPILFAIVIDTVGNYLSSIVLERSFADAGAVEIYFSKLTSSDSVERTYLTQWEVYNDGIDSHNIFDSTITRFAFTQNGIDTLDSNNFQRKEYWKKNK
jgi:hypothetical protein